MQFSPRVLWEVQDGLIQSCLKDSGSDPACLPVAGPPE